MIAQIGTELAREAEPFLAYRRPSSSGRRPPAFPAGRWPGAFSDAARATGIDSLAQHFCSARVLSCARHPCARAGDRGVLVPAHGSGPHSKHHRPERGSILWGLILALPPSSRESESGAWHTRFLQNSVSPAARAQRTSWRTHVTLVAEADVAQYLQRWFRPHGDESAKKWHRTALSGIH